MGEVVTSIRRVTDLMGEISSASSEQSAAVAQVGEAVTQMDQATQQNAALVEQMAAAASSLKSQASTLVQTVAVFKLNGSAGVGKVAVRSTESSTLPFRGAERRAMVTAKVTKSPGRPDTKARTTASTPVLAVPKYVATAATSDDWESF
jgi:hypothetical protein